MKLTIVYDNTSYNNELQSDWGFSSVIEVGNSPKILFDTGTKGSILLSNMEKLEIDPKTIEEIFISHNHYDHTGGMSDFLEVNNDVKVYVPPSLGKVEDARETVIVEKPLKLHENIFSTGELDGIEQSMAIKTEKGIVVVVGCSHPAMSHILQAASAYGELYGIIGGVHGFNEYELFKGMKLICTTHCTQHKAEIKSHYPDEYVEGGAGKIFEI
jgi:7,8-dihydropterin-6-yl-methyl-4-(beta-D-ribofuranosyl)aminobenzene 5'-phosphate synthase